MHQMVQEEDEILPPPHPYSNGLRDRLQKTDNEGLTSFQLALHTERVILYRLVIFTKTELRSIYR